MELFYRGTKDEVAAEHIGTVCSAKSSKVIRILDGYGAVAGSARVAAEHVGYDFVIRSVVASEIGLVISAKTPRRFVFIDAHKR